MFRAIGASPHPALCGVLTLWCAGASWAQVSVAATGETTPIPTAGASLSDVALWVHPTDRSRSLIVATDQLGGGVFTYDLNGQQVQFLVGPANGTDVRYGFFADAGSDAIVLVTRVSTGLIELFRVDPQTRTLTQVNARPLPTGLVVAGSALYVSPATGRLYAFVTGASGTTQQWELFEDGGAVDGQQVRILALSGPTDDVVADDRHGQLFISESARGVWFFDAEPTGPDAGQLIQSTDAGLASPVGALGLYRGGPGYLLVANGTEQLSVFSLQPPFSPRGDFRIVGDGGIDGVSGTQGLELTQLNMGGIYSQGLLLAHDALNDTTPNVKLVPWQSIATAFTPPLTIDLGTGTFDAGAVDGGADVGALDAGQPPAPADLGPSGGIPFEPTPSGCNCQGGLGGFMLATLALISMLIRRRRLG